MHGLSHRGNPYPRRCGVRRPFGIVSLRPWQGMKTFGCATWLWRTISSGMHLERISWSPAKLAAEQRRALRALLGVASARSAWHRERLAAIVVDDVTVEDIATLPVMTKSDLMDNFDDIVTDRRLGRAVCENHLRDLVDDAYLFDEYHIVTSGGASGQRGVFAYGWEAWATCYASVVRFQIRDWFSDPELAEVPRVAAVVAAANATHISGALGRTFSGPGTARHFLPVTLPLAEIVAGLNELQPTILQGYSSVLHRLALEARRGPAAHRAPPDQPHLRAAHAGDEGVAARKCGAFPIINGYGMSEGLFAGACPHGVHLPDDLCLVEVVDGRGRRRVAGPTG